MKLIAKCRNCKTEINLKSSATDRIDLAKEKGELFPMQCPNCLKNDIFHINEIRAKELKVIKIIAFGISIIGTPALVYYLWTYLVRPHNPYIVYAMCFVITFPAIIAFGLIKHQRDNVSRFNKYYG